MNWGHDVPNVRKKVECACCDRVGWHGGHGWIQACYDRWQRAGKPQEGPPMPGYRINWERYMELRTLVRASFLSATHQTGISERTAYRYEKRLKEMGLV